MSNLFISHSSKDKAAALELYDWLRQQGYDFPFVDSHIESGIPAGADWQQHLYLRLQTCQALIVVCSPNWQKSQWCFAELVYAKMAGKAVFPIIIEPCDLGAAAGQQQAVDLHREGRKAYDRLLKALTRRRMGPGDDFGWDENECPYPGLMSFEEKHAGVYFGRAGAIQDTIELLNQMRGNGQPRFLMITGSSGSGKSSLLKAGILARLRQKDSDDWLLLSRPLRHISRRDLHDSLLVDLARELVSLYPHDHASTPQWKELRDQLTGEPAAAAAALLEVVEDLSMASGVPNASLLLAIDQFEELLRTPHGVSEHSSPEGRFLTFLRAVFSSPDRRVLGVGTMRGDFEDAMERHDLKIHERFVTTYRVRPFPVENVGDVIVKPLERTAVRIDDELVERLKSDTPDGRALPLLAFALEKLYLDYGVDGVLSLEDYTEELGGIRGALNKAVREALGAEVSSPQHISALREAFTKHLVQLNEDDQPVRCRASWNAFSHEAKPLLERLADRRLLISSAGLDGGDPSLEVAHEALFREWKMLKDWIDESKQILRWRRDVNRDREGAGGEWKRLSPAQLATARSWPRDNSDQLHSDERAWIKDGLRRLLLIRVAVAAVVFALASLSIWALWAEQEATRQTELALDEKTAREKSEKAAVASARDANAQLRKVYRLKADVAAGEHEWFAASLFAAASIDYSNLGKPARTSGGRGSSPYVSASADLEAHRIAIDAKRSIRPIWSSPATQYHVERIDSVTFAQGGELLVTQGPDAVKIWRVDDGRQIHSWRVGAGESLSAFCAALRWLMFVDRESRSLRFRQISDGRLMREYGRDQLDASRVALSRDGGLLALQDLVGIEIIRLEDNRTVRRLEEFGARGADLMAFNASGRFLASTIGNVTKIWDLETGQGADCHREGLGSLRAIGFDSEDRLLGYVWSEEINGKTYGDRIKRWDLSGQAVGDPFPLGVSEAVVAAFDPDGEKVIFQAQEQSSQLSVVDLAGGSHLRQELVGHHAPISCFVFSPDGETIATGSTAALLKLWDARSGEVRTKEGSEHQLSVESIAVSPGGTTMISGSEDGSIAVWDLESGSRQVTFSQDTNAVYAVAPSPDGRYIASGGGREGEGEDGSARIWVWDLSDETESRSWETGGEYVGDLFFSPDGTELVSLTESKVEIWDWRTGDRLEEHVSDSRELPVWACFSQDGQRLAINDGQSLVIRSRVEDGEDLVLDRETTVAGPVSFHPVRDLLVAVSDSEVMVWDYLKREQVASFSAGNDDVWSLVFNHDGRTLVTGSESGIVKMWDFDKVVRLGVGRTSERLASAGLIAKITAHDSSVNAIRFTPDSRLLVTGGRDNIIKIWDASAANPLRRYGAESRERVVGFVTDRSRELVVSCVPEEAGRISMRDVVSGEEVGRTAIKWKGPISAGAPTGSGVVPVWETDPDAGFVLRKWGRLRSHA